MAPVEPPYDELLRAAIANSGTSRRKLSYALAERTGNQQASEYRALGKYLSGDETPGRERGAILAVILDSPELALVPTFSSRRVDRLARLEAEVSQLRSERDSALEAVVLRLADLEAGLESVEQLLGQLRSGGAR